MSSVVLDASAILAVIHQEDGHRRLTPAILSRAVAGAVNLAEVQGKLVSRGWSSEEAWEDATSPVKDVIPFTADHARLAVDLITRTRHLGLSLGDRACLALALALGVPVYTADKKWQTLKLAVRVHAIR